MFETGKMAIGAVCLDMPRFVCVRPAGRTLLEVEVLYRPDRGNC